MNQHVNGNILLLLIRLVVGGSEVVFSRCVVRSQIYVFSENYEMCFRLLGRYCFLVLTLLNMSVKSIGIQAAKDLPKELTTVYGY